MTKEEFPQDMEEILRWFRSTYEQESKEKNEYLKRTLDLERDLASLKAKAETYEEEWRKALIQVESLRDQLAVLKDRLDSLHEELRRERTARKECGECLERAETVIESLRKSLHREESRSKTLQAAKNALEANVRNLRQQVILQESQIQSLYGSYSWRVTAPLRWTYGFLLTIFHRLRSALEKTLSENLYKIYRLAQRFNSSLERYPWLNSFVSKLLQRFPWISTRIQRFRAGFQPRIPISVVEDVDFSGTLSPRARFIFSQLQLAVFHGSHRVTTSLNMENSHTQN